MHSIRILWLIGVLMLPACDLLDLDSVTPRVRFEQLDVEDVDFSGIEADFVFAIDNPNPVQVGLESFRYALDLSGVRLLEGDDDDGFTIAASDSSPLRLPVSLRWQNVWDTAQAVRGKDDVPFGLGGRLGFNTPIGPIRLPYDVEGDFPAVRTPRVRPVAARVRPWNPLTPLQLQAEVDIALDNAHGSVITFERFDYGIDVGGTQAVSGLVDGFANVEGGEERVMPLPIVLRATDLGASIFELVRNNGRAPVRLRATTEVGTPFGTFPLAIDEVADLVFRAITAGGAAVDDDTDAPTDTDLPVHDTDAPADTDAAAPDTDAPIDTDPS